MKTADFPNFFDFSQNEINETKEEDKKKLVLFTSETPAHKYVIARPPPALPRISHSQTYSLISQKSYSLHWFKLRDARPCGATYVRSGKVFRRPVTTSSAILSAFRDCRSSFTIASNANSFFTISILYFILFGYSILCGVCCVVLLSIREFSLFPFLFFFFVLPIQNKFSYLDFPVILFIFSFIVNLFGFLFLCFFFSLSLSLSFTSLSPYVLTLC